MLLLYRREELAERWPEELGGELATINADVEVAVKNHAVMRYGKGVSAAALRRVVFTLVDVPYAVGRRHLINGEPPPPLADELVAETLWCVLIGDTSSGI